MPDAAVKIDVLASVDQVESPHPEGHGGAQQQHTQTDVIAQGNPGRDGRETVSDPQHQVREQGETLGVGIEKQDRNRHGRKLKGQRAEFPSRQRQQSARKHRKAGGKAQR